MASFRYAQAVRQLSTSSVRNKLASAPIQLFGLEGRYAHALYSAASKEKKLDVVEKDLKNIQGLLMTKPQIKDFLLDPTLKKQEKISALGEILKSQNSSNLTVNFFGALTENGRLLKMNSMINAFSKLMGAHRGEVFATVTTAKALDAKQVKELETSLQGFLSKGQSLQMETKVDASIIGGMVVSIGDKYIDMSMQSKIKTYTNLIKEAV
ncbi:ATP synthase subunit O, mitochondrial-like [Lineus longissimus]|uniref:ATP synthase subunit O, mitochondrial-like n=1 Tax=Lineus longissimus TaxID=88925 RepID=UPI002B4EC5EF